MFCHFYQNNVKCVESETISCNRCHRGYCVDHLKLCRHCGQLLCAPCEYMSHLKKECKNCEYKTCSKETKFKTCSHGHQNICQDCWDRRIKHKVQCDKCQQRHKCCFTIYLICQCSPPHSDYGKLCCSCQRKPAGYFIKTCKLCDRQVCRFEKRFPEDSPCYVCREYYCDSHRLYRHIGKYVCLSCRIKLRVIRQYMMEYLYQPESNYVNKIKDNFDQLMFIRDNS